MLFAAFRFPCAAAAAAHSLARPGAAATVAGQAAGAVGPVVAGGDADPDGSVASDLALQTHRPVLVVKDLAVADMNVIPIGAVACPALGDDENTPGAIKYGAGKSRTGNRGAGRSQNKRHEPTTKP